MQLTRRRSFGAVFLMLWLLGTFCLRSAGLTQQGTVQVSGKLDIHSIPQRNKKPAKVDVARRQIENGELFNEVKLFPAARESCSKALSDTSDPILRSRAKDCIKKSIDEDQGLLHSLNASTYEEVTLFLNQGEIDKALERVREAEKYSTGEPNPVGLVAAASESAKVKQLVEAAQRPESRWKSIFEYRFVSKLFLEWLPWFSEGVVKGILILTIIAVLIALIYFYRWVFGYTARGWSHTRWIVWSVQESESRGGAGAVMDALQLASNTLLMDHYTGSYRPASLLFAPRLLDGRSGNRVLWNFLGDRGLQFLFPIESIPIEAMERHTFDLREAFDELDIKVGGAEIKGFVGLFRNYQKWLYKGLPALRAVIAQVKDAGQTEWTIRLVCNYEKRWWWRQKRIPRTIAVYASAPAELYVDTIGLAAHRAAFKLFYRLALPGTDSDHATAVASSHQGLQMLLLLL